MCLLVLIFGRINCVCVMFFFFWFGIVVGVGVLIVCIICWIIMLFIWLDVLFLLSVFFSWLILLNVNVVGILGYIFDGKMIVIFFLFLIFFKYNVVLIFLSFEYEILCFSWFKSLIIFIFLVSVFIVYGSRMCLVVL